ncbi:MAG: transglutaminase family protein [Pseudomonadota bacterium]
MTTQISAHFSFKSAPSTDVLLQFEAAAGNDQRVSFHRTHITGSETIRRVPAEEGVGERMWARGEGRVDVSYEAEVELMRSFTRLEGRNTVALTRLPSEAVKYLLDSRYCEMGPLVEFAERQFGHIETGGAQALAIRDWVASHLSYTRGSSDPETDALDTFKSRKGVCRDYAHLVVTLARACSIPARYAACYAPSVTPQDFHAVAQVYLADPNNPAVGAWHLLDATGMASAEDAVLIGVGRDAGDVSFVTSFGPMQLLDSRVSVSAGDGPALAA